MVAAFLQKVDGVGGFDRSTHLSFDCKCARRGEGYAQALDGRNRVIVITEPLARVIAAIRTASIR